MKSHESKPEQAERKRKSADLKAKTYTHKVTGHRQENYY